ncbi:16S rRNA (cytidine(1402)-2'-O)-methyltransferase [Streptococcus marimammalium]|uniref:16S rRNA (cytidine(1402)-2'-O)-methyltransferase n=1 Tax=Streptococcus marimammalium TaxID=269666 RepID=UPI00037DEDF4|nr:16S rRNA (cytidine(1402)-2'-O)-methyltransferase [Streptococcus marimammalium]
MQIQKSFKKSQFGTLYLVATPIGNLEDMTFRSLSILKTVDLIAAEDTRNTGILLKHFNISTRQTSFHEHNAFRKTPDLIALLESGKSIAQVSDAGLPSISDPGHDLVVAAIEKNINVVALPGASAGITALIASGLAPQPHIFYGFLPRKISQQKAFFQQKLHYPETQIFYESPYRVKETLTTMLSVYGNRQVVVVRELTKLFEEYQRGSLKEVIEFIEKNPLKGECLVIVSGAKEIVGEVAIENLDIAKMVELLINDGLKPNQAIKKIAKDHQINRQDVYNRYHQLNE